MDDWTPDTHFRSAQPVSRGRWLVTLTFGPLAWLTALAVAGWLMAESAVVQVGLAVTGVAFVAAGLVLGLLWRRFRAEEGLHVDGD